jgi:hypothetical protein
MKYKLIILLLIITVSVGICENFVPGQILIQFNQNCRNKIQIADIDGIAKTTVQSVDQLNQKWNVYKIEKLIRDPHPNELAQKFGLDLLYLLSFPTDKNVSMVVKDYESADAIEFAGPNLILPVDIVPNDPMYSSQWHLVKTQCPVAWDATTGDTTVAVMAIDQGVEYTHSDLQNSFLINNPEDINHNHRFDPVPVGQGGDLDGIDQDGNGYADDVIGYDFVSNDPNPIPEGSDDHGTLCAGVEVAETNNNIGVASFGWKCRQVVARAGYSGGVYIAQAITSLYYAVSRGVWAISMSFGGSTPYDPFNNAIQYAWQGGKVLTGSAGNEYSGGALRYPAGYNNVISCAASDAADHRSDWGGGQESNYGTWVDLAAPGTGVLTTDIGNGYEAPDGTSFSAPCVAGEALLLKAMFPTMTNDQCTTRIFQSCDTMPDVQYHAGNLGHGRINVAKAIYQSIRCNLRTTAFRLNDGNNNYPQPNEAVAMITTMYNELNYQNATNVSATLTCQDPNIIITKNTATFPNINAGVSQSCSADSFVFQVAANAIPHRVRFIVNIIASPPSLHTTDTVYVNVCFPRILLVDDDAGADYERWYKESIDSLKTLYRIWTVVTDGSPTQDTLLNYPVVVWFTGFDSLNTLTSTDQTNLTGYLNQGHNLFICGQNIGQNIETTPFYSNYLHAQYAVSNTGIVFMVGVPGDPIGGVYGDTIVTGGSGGAANAWSNDGIRPIGGAYGCFRYRNYSDTTVYGAIRYSGSYKVVYFGLPFEAIDHTPGRYIQKWEIMRRILNFFSEPLPGIEQEQPSIVNNYLKPSLNLSPNPFSSKTRIKFSQPVIGNAQVHIYNINGELVKSIATNSSIVLWDGTDQSGRKLVNGVYFCELKTTNGSVTTKAIVLQ